MVNQLEQILNSLSIQKQNAENNNLQERYKKLCKIYDIINSAKGQIDAL